MPHDPDGSMFNPFNRLKVIYSGEELQRRIDKHIASAQDRGFMLMSPIEKLNHMKEMVRLLELEQAEKSELTEEASKDKGQ